MGRLQRERLVGIRVLQAEGRAALVWARIFSRMLEEHRRDDGTRWTYSAIERASEGVVPHPFSRDLAAARIQEPSFVKLAALGLVFGEPPEAWILAPEWEHPDRVDAPQDSS